MNTRKDKWIERDVRDKAIQRLAKLPTETGTARFVPVAHFERFVFGLWPEDDSGRHG